MRQTPVNLLRSAALSAGNLVVLQSAVLSMVLVTSLSGVDGFIPFFGLNPFRSRTLARCFGAGESLYFGGCGNMFFSKRPRRIPSHGILADSPDAAAERKSRLISPMWSTDDENEALHHQERETVDHDMELLKYRIARNKALGPGMKPNEAPPKEVHIILFYPESENEGVHTIEFPKGSGNNVILGFEDLKECMNFSALLKDEQFYEPTPRNINLESLEAYCETIGVQVQVVPRGTNLVPPSGTVEELNHTPTLDQKQAHLEQLFALDVAFEDELLENEGVLFRRWQESQAKEQSVAELGAWE